MALHRQALAWTIVMVCMASALANTYYISPQGSDSNTGASPYDPFLTLSQALDASSNWDQIVVAPGIYTGSLNTGLTFGYRNLTTNSNYEAYFVPVEEGPIWTVHGDMYMERMQFNCTGLPFDSTAVSVTGGSFVATLLKASACRVGLDLAVDVWSAQLKDPYMLGNEVGINVASGTYRNLKEISILYGQFRCRHKAINLDTQFAEANATGPVNLDITSTDFNESGISLITESLEANFERNTFQECINSETGGGAIYAVTDGALTLQDNAFLGCAAAGAGGAVHFTSMSPGNSQASLTVDSGVFDKCTSSLTGGALTFTGVSATVTDVTFASNIAQMSGGAISGSGRDNGRASVEITECVFRGNSALLGGAVTMNNLQVGIYDSEFRRNLSHYHGGAVVLDDCNSNIDEAVFLFNRGGPSDGEGGALFVNSLKGLSVCSISHTLFRSNGNGETGGGCGFWNSVIDLQSVNFTKNGAVDGGGFSSYGSTTVTGDSVAFTGNSARYDGGGFYCSHGATVNIDNVVFDDNTAGTATSTGCDCSSCSLSGVNNLTNDTIQGCAY